MIASSLMSCLTANTRGIYINIVGVMKKIVAVIIVVVVVVVVVVVNNVGAVAEVEEWLKAQNDAVRS